VKGEKEMRIAFAAVVIMLAVPAAGQDHNHGTTVPDWYDTDCCNLQDCRPIDAKDVEFGFNGLGNPVVMYQPIKIEFTKDRWRKSKDERYHACFRGNQDAGWTVYCIYLPALG